MFVELDYTTGKKLGLEITAGSLLTPLKITTENVAHRDLERSLSMADNVDLYTLAREAGSIVFIVEDHTRHSPVLETLEYLKFEFGRRAISWDKVKLLVATGTHRKMTEIELIEKFASFLASTEIIQHDAADGGEMKDFGNYMNVPLRINRNVESDLLVAIGSIVPHRFSGWSGGAKMVVPGVASYETVFQSHRMAILNSSADVGVVENEFRDLIDETGSRVGLDFIINYYYGKDGTVKGCVSGDHITAHRRGVELAKGELLRVFDHRSDITVISSYPSTTDFWQGGKALYTADLITKDGGDIIMVSPLNEGFGDHPAFAKLLRLKSAEILEELDGLTAQDPLAYVAAYAVKNIMERKRVHIVSDTAYRSMFDEIGLSVHDDLQKTIDSIKAKDREIVVLENSYILPQVETTMEVKL